MKALKYSFMVLAFAIVANVTLASADRSLGSNQTGTSGTVEIHVGQTAKIEPFIKTKDSTQYFINEYTHTTSTDPCPKCDIVATLQHRVNGKWDNIASSGNTRMGQKKDFSGNTAELKGIYALSIRRNNLTAAITYVQYEWYIQPKSN